MSLLIVDPTAGPVRPGTLAPRLGPSAFANARVGIIWNGRPHGDKGLRYVMRTLHEMIGVREAVLLKKPFIGNIAPEGFFDELQGKPVDFILTGLGD